MQFVFMGLCSVVPRQLQMMYEVPGRGSEDMDVEQRHDTTRHECTINLRNSNIIAVKPSSPSEAHCLPLPFFERCNVLFPRQAATMSDL